MSLKRNDEWYEARQEWVEGRGLTMYDVMVDEKGVEYVMSEADENGKHTVVELPTNLQTNNDSAE